MKKLILGVLIGWILNIACYEYQQFEDFDLVVDALDKNLIWKNDKSVFEINDYVTDHRTKIFDYINYRPNLWTCRHIFDHDKCMIKSLLRSPIPIKDRPTRK